MDSALLIVFGYLCGSIPFGVLLTRRVSGVDVRKQGSGNIGATNVARVAGKKIGAAVLLLDAVKGTLPVGLALWLRPGNPLLHAAVGMAAVLGHIFPMWLNFRGGKGVATALGVLTSLMPLAGIAGVLGYALVFGLFRVSSVGSLCGGLVAVASAFALHRLQGQPIAYAFLAAALLTLMLITHRSNLKRLFAREEARF